MAARWMDLADGDRYGYFADAYTAIVRADFVTIADGVV